MADDVGDTVVLIDEVGETEEVTEAVCDGVSVDERVKEDVGDVLGVIEVEEVLEIDVGISFVTYF